MILLLGAGAALHRPLAAAARASGQACAILHSLPQDVLAWSIALSELPAAAVTTLLVFGPTWGVPAQPRLLAPAFIALAHWGRTRSMKVSSLLVSSADVYLLPPPGVRVSEDAPLREDTPSVEAERAFFQAAAETSFPAVAARLFTLVGPEVRRLADVLASARLVGGMLDILDWLDERDAAAALVALAAAATGREAVNVCAGRGVARGEVVARLNGGTRPPDGGSGEGPPWLVGNPARLQRLTGGEAGRISLDESVAFALAP